MSSELKWIANKLPKTEDRNLSIMAAGKVKKARAFHESFPQYAETPLVDLKKMAELLGLAKVAVKDESYRFGLNAFKVLGGSYAIACYIAEQLGRDVSDITYAALTSAELKKEFGTATFFSATDGNHGRGVAWSANQLGQKAVIIMPKGSTETRLANIRKENAKAWISEANYDECVRQAAALAAKTEHGVIIQDTAWEGYEKIPSWIMQGYGTMADEASEQFGSVPTHIFIQAGVGSLAGAVIGYFANKYKKNPPIMTVVEAAPAACLYKGALAGDGKPRIVTGEMNTIMAGLACGEPNTISWDILKNHAACFIAASDSVAARGMRMLGAPLKGDTQVVSGESGAVTFGVLATIMENSEYQQLRQYLRLGSQAKVLLFSTEGDTDPQRWRNIVWNAEKC